MMAQPVPTTPLKKPELAALTRINDGLGPCSVYYVRQGTTLTNPAARRLLRILMRRGLIEPVPYRNRRIYLWQVTPAGRALVEAGTKSPQQETLV